MIPYFDNLILYGDLQYDYTLFEYGLDHLFILKDREGMLYLAYELDPNNECQWIITRITKKSLQDLILKKETLYKTFMTSGNPIVYDELTPNGTEHSAILKRDHTLKKYMPSTKVVFAGDQKEALEYLESLDDIMSSTLVILTNRKKVRYNTDRLREIRKEDLCR